MVAVKSVTSFVGNALYWIERFGIDALRVDAVASMIYRDYSRKEGSGSRTNLAVARILKRLNFLRNTNRNSFGEQVSGAGQCGGVYRFPGVSSAGYGRSGLLGTSGTLG